MKGVGRQLRPLYLRYVDLTNKQARLNGFEDYGDQWRHNYDTTELEVIVKNLYQQVEPLYKQLHAYIRRQLYRTYGAENISLTGTLPAHLLGDMLKLDLISGQTAIERVEELPRGCLSASRAGHKEEGTLARADCDAVD